MPGILRPDLACPMCGKQVICVFHEWSGSQDTATFEYHHHDDPQRECDGLEPKPCLVVLPYAEGLERMKEVGIVSHYAVGLERERDYTDKLRLIGVVSGLLGRPEFRWKWLGYGNYACVSCGAHATADDSDGQVGRIEPCSRNCPWSAAETVLSEILAGDEESA